MARANFGRFRSVLILVCALLLSLVFSGMVLADQTTTLGGGRFEIIEASSTSAYFTITSSGCDDTDENCTVRVTSSANITSHANVGTYNNDNEIAWKNVFEAICGASGNPTNHVTGSDGNENKEFEECWEAQTGDHTFNVFWPIIKPDDKFDVRPHCDDNDNQCAVELGICYNPADCRDDDRVTRATDTNTASSDIAEFWEDAGSCLYDDDEEDVWECIDDEFQDWLDDELNNSDDYDDLIDELERSRNDDLGLSILGYDDDLNEVGDADDDDDDPETLLERYQRRWRSARPVSIYRDMDKVDEGSYSFRPTQDDYLTINVTDYLELGSPIQVCNTPLGCFALTGQSEVFRQYMQSFYVLILDRKIMRCMDDAGWDTDDDHVISLNNASLIACDERIKTAAAQCPAASTGAKQVLFSLYDIGLLTGLVSSTYAQQLRSDVEQARVRTPECLCAAGFVERDMIMSTSRNDDPWQYTGARHPRNVCDD